MNKLVGFCYSLLRCLIIPLCGFYFFAAIVDISFIIIIESDIVVGEIFFQQGKIELSKTLILVAGGQLFILYLLYIQFFAYIDIIVFEKPDGYY